MTVQELVVVFRVQASLDGRMYRWYTPTRDEAEALAGRLTELFPGVMLWPLEQVERHAWSL